MSKSDYVININSVVTVGVWWNSKDKKSSYAYYIWIFWPIGRTQDTLQMALLPKKGYSDVGVSSGFS